jgi:dTMP kinase
VTRPKKRQTGLFLTFEGPDGSGKTTQSQKLLGRLLEAGYDAVWTREPGGTRLGEVLRELMLDNDPELGEVSPRVEAMLLSAARAHHIDDLIRPALDTGKIVVCDRFVDSTIAYQGGGSKLDIEALRRVNHFATSGLVPDLVILVDIPAADGIARRLKLVAGDPEALSRMEKRGLGFHNRVRRQFLNSAARAPNRWLSLDGRDPEQTLSDTIWRRVEEELRARSVKPIGTQPVRLF